MSDIFNGNKNISKYYYFFPGSGSDFYCVDLDMSAATRESNKVRRDFVEIVPPEDGSSSTLGEAAH